MHARVAGIVHAPYRYECSQSATNTAMGGGITGIGKREREREIEETLLLDLQLFQLETWRKAVTKQHVSMKFKFAPPKHTGFVSQYYR